MELLLNILDELREVAEEGKLLIPTKLNVLINTKHRSLFADLEGEDLLEDVIIELDDIQFRLQFFELHDEEEIVLASKDLIVHFKVEELLYDEE